MVQFSPVSGFRYDLSQVGALSEVTCPPPDQISEDQQDELYQRHPCNAVRLVLNREEPGDTSPLDRCLRADDFFQIWRKEHILLPEHESAAYFYQQTRTCNGVPQSTVSVIGRVKLSDADTHLLGSVIPVCDDRIADRLQLIQTCHGQFVPVHALLVPAHAMAAQTMAGHAITGQAIAGDTTAGDAERSMGPLSELLPMLHHVTPVELTDDDNVTHRLWPATDREVVNVLQQRLRHMRAVVVGEAEQLQAAQRFLAAHTAHTAMPADPQADPRQQSAAADVLMCLTEITGAQRPYELADLWDTFSAVLPVEGAQLLSPEKLQSQLGSGLRVQLVGDEPGALADAIELAALNDTPAIVVGGSRGDWSIVSASETSPDSGQHQSTRTISTHRLNRRWQLARQVLMRFQTSAASGSVTDFDFDCDVATLVTLARQAMFARDVAQIAQVTSSANSLVLIVPPMTVDEILQAGLAVDQSRPTDPIVGLRMSLPPLSGLVFNSLEH